MLYGNMIAKKQVCELVTFKRLYRSLFNLISYKNVPRKYPVFFFKISTKIINLKKVSYLYEMLRFTK